MPAYRMPGLPEDEWPSVGVLPAETDGRRVGHPGGAPGTGWCPAGPARSLGRVTEGDFTHVRAPPAVGRSVPDRQVLSTPRTGAVVATWAAAATRRSHRDQSPCPVGRLGWPSGRRARIPGALTPLHFSRPARTIETPARARPLSTPGAGYVSCAPSGGPGSGDGQTMAMMRLRREDPRLVGSFRLHRRLGAGGMGVVYLGSDRRGQRVALKVIRPDLAEDQEFRSRFAREVSAARRIRGGCTARLVAADLEADRPWFATQYVPGPSLHDKVAEEGPWPPPRSPRSGRRSPRAWWRCTRRGGPPGPEAVEHPPLPKGPGSSTSVSPGRPGRARSPMSVRRWDRRGSWRPSRSGARR